MSGSYTVEGAFVMSIGLFALLSLLFLAFYLHDVQALQAEMNEVADRAAAEGWGADQIEEAWVQKQREWKPFFIRLEEAELSGTDGWQQKVYFPVPAYARLFFRSTVRDGYVSVKITGFCPERFIRQTEAVKDVIE